MASEFLQPFVAQIVGGARVCSLGDVKKGDSDIFGFIDVDPLQMVGESDSFNELTLLLKQFQETEKEIKLSPDQFMRVFRLVPHCTPAPILARANERYGFPEHFLKLKRFFVGFYFIQPLSAMCELLKTCIHGDFERMTEILEYMHSTTPPKSINNETSNALFNLMLRLILFGILGKLLHVVPRDFRDEDSGSPKALRKQAYKFNEYFKRLLELGVDEKVTLGDMLSSSLTHMQNLRSRLECDEFDDMALLMSACAHLANSLSDKCTKMGILDSCT
jgi:hypothetical protein